MLVSVCSRLVFSCSVEAVFVSVSDSVCVWDSFSISVSVSESDSVSVSDSDSVWDSISDSDSVSASSTDFSGVLLSSFKEDGSVLPALEVISALSDTAAVSAAVFWEVWLFSLLFSKLSSALDDGAVSDDVCVSDDLTSDECSFSVFSSNALSEDFSGSFADSSTSGWFPAENCSFSAFTNSPRWPVAARIAAASAIEETRTRSTIGTTWCFFFFTSSYVSSSTSTYRLTSSCFKSSIMAFSYS